MPAFVFFVEFALLFVCFLVHIVLWRWRRPRNHGAALGVIFLLPLVVATLFLMIFLQTSSFPENLFSILLLHLSVSSAYILTYPALEGLSPSLLCLLLIGKERTGLTAKELRLRFDETILREQKMQDLLDSGLILESEGKVCVTERGKRFVRPFLLLRRLLGLPLGQG